MALQLNGTTGYLEYPNKIMTAFPCSMLLWVSKDVDTGALQFPLMHAQSNADRRACLRIETNSNMAAELRNPGSSNLVEENVATDPDTTMRLAIAVFTSTISMSVYMGTSTPVTAVVTNVDDVASHDVVAVGTLHNNSGSPALFLNGKVAEVHFYNVALSAGPIASLLSDSVKPESTTGWIDGWTLVYTGAGTYTSIGGTRTLTVNGGVTDAGTHPISRAGTAARIGTMCINLTGAGF